jgi:hypothetical protein
VSGTCLAPFIRINIWSLHDHLTHTTIIVPGFAQIVTLFQKKEICGLAGWPECFHFLLPLQIRAKEKRPAWRGA